MYDAETKFYPLGVEHYNNQRLKKNTNPIPHSIFQVHQCADILWYSQLDADKSSIRICSSETCFPESIMSIISSIIQIFAINISIAIRWLVCYRSDESSVFNVSKLSFCRCLFVVAICDKQCNTPPSNDRSTLVAIQSNITNDFYEVVDRWLLSLLPKCINPMQSCCRCRGVEYLWLNLCQHSVKWTLNIQQRQFEHPEKSEEQNFLRKLKT